MMRLKIPKAVPLPHRPLLARSLLPDNEIGEGAPPGIRPGELLSITNSTPDGGQVFATICATKGPTRQGWLPQGALHFLEPGEAAAVPHEAQLSLKEQLQGLALVCATEDWQDPEDASALGVRGGEVLQLSTVSEGWAFGWPPESTGRRGWFPLALAEKLPACMASLVRREEEELSASASLALVELLRTGGEPPPQQWAFDGELPALVTESAQCVERQWREHFEQMAVEKEALAAEAEGEEAAQPTEAARRLFAVDNSPEETYLLVVCKTRFVPPRGTSGGLLALEIGDLVRVTSLPEAEMYYGFLDGKSATRGWFPKRHVRTVEDPLSTENDRPVEQLGPPPLPKLPPALQQRRRRQ